MEVTSRLTLARRPGLSAYNTQFFSAIDQFYSFRLEDSQTIYVMADAVEGVYDATGPNTKDLLFKKSPGAQQTSFQSVLDILYMSDGPDQWKWVKSPKTWQCNTQYFEGDYIIDPNGNIERVGRVIDLPPSSPQNPTKGPLTAGTGITTGPGVPWIAPSNVSSNLNYASVTTVAGGSLEVNAPGTVTSPDHTWKLNGPSQWTQNGANFTTGYLVCTNFSGLSIPLGSRILGVEVVFLAGTQAGGTPSYINNVALFHNGAVIGTPDTSYTQQLASTTFSQPPQSKVDVGSSTDLWGFNSWTPAIFDSTFGIGISIKAGNFRTVVDTEVSMSITVTYASATNYSSQFLQATNFGFTTSNNPAGIQVMFSSYVTSPSTDALMTAQLIYAGNPIGEPKTILPSTTSKILTLGTPDDLWGTLLTFAEVNSSTFGVEFVVSGGGTWNVGNVRIIDTTTLGNLVSGPCGFGQPLWPTQWGGSVVDGSITWFNNGSALQLFSIQPPQFAPGVTNIALPSASIAGLTVWAANTWYLPALRIVDSNNYIQQIITAGTTGAVQPAWNDGAYLNTTNDGTVVWKRLTNATWASNFAYNIGDAVSVTYNVYTAVSVGNNYVSGSYTRPAPYTGFWKNSVASVTEFFICVQAGSSASVAPVNPSFATDQPLPSPFPSNTWQTGIGTLISDGGVIWQNAGLSATWNTFGGTQKVAAVNTVIDTNGFQEQAQTPAESGPAINWQNITPGQTQIDLTQTWLNVGAVSSGIALSPGLGLGASTLVWHYYYTWRNSVTGDESSASPVSSQILLAPNSAVAVSGFYSPDPQVDTVRIYRTAAGGAIPFLDAEIPNVLGTGRWSYTDTNPDSTLNNLIIAPLDHVNDPVPVGLVHMTFHLGRIFGSVGSTVYYSGGPDTNPGNPSTAFDPLNYFIFPSLVSRMVPTANGLFVFTVDDIYVILGAGTSNSPLYAQPYAIGGIGLLSYNELDVNAGTIYMKTTDGQVLELQLGAGVSELGFPIGDQFVVLTTGTGNGFVNGQGYLTWHTGGSPDKAVYMANGTDGWFRCSPTAAPETGVHWSPKATFASGGAKAVQSIEVAQGVKRLLVGPSSSGPILMRDLNASSDNGFTFTCFATIGGITLAQPGQTSDVVFIATDCMKEGSRVTPSALFDELPSSQQFISLLEGENPVPDPPQLEPSDTIYNDRWWTCETQEPTACRWMFLKLEWPSEAFFNELLEFSIFGCVSKE